MTQPAAYLAPQNGHAAPSLIQQPRRPAAEKPHIPNHDLAAEAAIVGTLAMCFAENTDRDARDLVTQAVEIVAPEDFFYSVNQKIVALVYQMFWAQTPIDLITISHEMHQSGIYEECGGMMYLTACIEQCPTTNHVESYARIVAKKAEERRAAAILEKAARTMFDGGTLDDVRRALDALNDIQERTAPKNTLETYSLNDLQKMNVPPLAWIVEGLIPVGLTLLAGDPKIGKSWLLYGLSLAVASGTKEQPGRVMGTYPAPCGGVLYAGLEDTPRRMKSRAEKLLAHDSRPWPDALRICHSLPELNDAGLGVLEKYLAANPLIKLVVIDTFERARRERKQNGNAYGEDTRALSGLQELAGRLGIAIVIVQHKTKAEHGDATRNVSGSMGMTGTVDNIITVSRKRGSDEGVLEVVPRDGEEQKIAMRWDANLATWIALGDADKFGMSAERAEILEYLEGQKTTQKIGEIAVALGIPTGNCKALLHNMKHAGQVISEGGLYRAPKDGEKGVHSKLPMTAITDNQSAGGDFGGAAILNVLSSSGELREDAGAIVEPLIPRLSVIAVIAVIGYLQELQLNLAAYSMRRLSELRDFVWWWHNSYDLPLNQSNLECYFPAFCANPHGCGGNLPPWLDKPRA